MNTFPELALGLSKNIANGLSKERGRVMKMISVSRTVDGAKVYVNPENICAVYPRFDNKEITVIQFPGNDENYLEVIESADSVACMSVL